MPTVYMHALGLDPSLRANGLTGKATSFLFFLLIPHLIILYIKYLLLKSRKLDNVNYFIKVVH